jgi:hypothetical protein
MLRIVAFDLQQQLGEALAITARHSGQFVDVRRKAGKLRLRPTTECQRRQTQWGEVEP